MQSNKIEDGKGLKKYIEAPYLNEKFENGLSRIIEKRIEEPVYLGVFKRTWIVIISGIALLIGSIVAISCYLSAPKMGRLILGVYLIGFVVIVSAGKTELNTHKKTREGGQDVK